MASLTLDGTASASDESTSAVAAPWSRLAKLAVTVFGRKTSEKPASGGHIDGDLSGLNDETLIDLGLDPASYRHPVAHMDPRDRFYL